MLCVLDTRFDSNTTSFYVNDWEEHLHVSIDFFFFLQLFPIDLVF